MPIQFYRRNILSKIILNENIDIDIRKEQALQLNIDLLNDMTQEHIEEKITAKLENAMRELKGILNEINSLEFELN